MSSDLILCALRAAAIAHQPDRTAILARIERGRAALDPAWTPRAGRRRAALRAVGMVATVAALLGLSVAVTWAAVGNDGLYRPSRGPVVVVPAPTSGSPGEVAQEPATTSRAPSGSHGPRSPAASPGAKGDQQGFLRSNGAIDAHSTDYWAQSNVTVVTGETLTALEVTVRIGTTPNLSSTGAWSTVLAGNLVTTVEQQPGALVYRFTLKPGVRLWPGSYVFAVQYNHAVGGRDSSRDTYGAAATAGGTRVEVTGGF